MGHSSQRHTLQQRRGWAGWPFCPFRFDSLVLSLPAGSRRSPCFHKRALESTLPCSRRAWRPEGPRRKAGLRPCSRWCTSPASSSSGTLCLPLEASGRPGARGSGPTCERGIGQLKGGSCRRWLYAQEAVGNPAEGCGSCLSGEKKVEGWWDLALQFWRAGVWERERLSWFYVALARNWDLWILFIKKEISAPHRKHAVCLAGSMVWAVRAWMAEKALSSPSGLPSLTLWLG